MSASRPRCSPNAGFRGPPWLSTGAVYRYFPSKAELVLAVVAGRDGTVDGRLPGESPAGLIGRLAQYVTPGHGRAHARLVAQIWGDAAIEPELAAVAIRSHQRLETHLAGLLHASWAESGDRADDATAVAQVALAALIGMSALVAAGDPVDTDSFVQIVTRMLASSADPGAAAQNS